MKNNKKKENLVLEEQYEKGFSKDQIHDLSQKNIEDLHWIENTDDPADDKKHREEEIQKKKQMDHGDPNDGGPRPPKEEEFPDEDEDDDLLSEVSDPEKVD
jgi:hypothetical protein